jgi:hypothetical protein
MNEWLETHKSHRFGFVRRRWPGPTHDEEGFPLPDAAVITEPLIMTSLHCAECNRGIRVAVDQDIGQDITS